ncbi:class I SAM-dependent methyltransferase [Puniceicoccales bacterium CK1056]|uniref:Class I SAM-dependent methyltransferase n=1 Tax=Oceanipulchritudo coccoides TaxID=2706888 RepID=A0A6B2M133_9BACT|nr:class I SAM-dependent methyltransferase [Oceanipulchritudo coccoides]NDV62701.1 class I SAM-dependent methyltransferase [Oceanipulchritudo coccoides]
MEAEVFQRMAEQENRHWWFRARRRILQSLIEKYADPSRFGKLKILEAGSGTGGNLEMLSRFGQVSAFELDKTACQITRSRGFEVREGRLPSDHPFVDDRFDLIVLFDVLEHVEADQESLSSLAALLEPGGILVLTVPAFPFLWSGHDEKHHHFRRYRRPGLRGQLQQAGLQIKRITYFNSFLFPVVAMVRCIKKLVHSKHSDEEGLPAPWLNLILEKVFSSERFLLSMLSFPFGVSLLSICQRPKR